MRMPITFAIGLQVILLGIELGGHYDTGVRQLALSFTNVASTVGFVWFDRWLSRRGGRLSTFTIMIVLAGIWLDALGNFAGWYGAFWWYDRITHGVGGMAVTALFIDLLQAQGRFTGPITKLTALWVGFFLGQFVASMYEVSEWIGDELFNTARVRSAFDTPRDLLNNTLGGLVAVGWFWLTNRKK